MSTPTKRIPWSPEEDLEITESYGGDWIVTYPMLANRMNTKYHGGNPVRSPRAVERREVKLEKIRKETSEELS